MVREGKMATFKEFGHRLSPAQTGEYRLNEGLEYPEGSVLLRVPRDFLWGIKPREAYSRVSRVRVETGLTYEGVAFLEKLPIVACVVPTNIGLMLPILQGHHRARYSGGFGIDVIPTAVCSLEVAAGFFDCGSTDYLEKEIGSGIAVCWMSFSRANLNGGCKRVYAPMNLRGVFSLEELVSSRVFRPFD